MSLLSSQSVRIQSRRGGRTDRLRNDDCSSRCGYWALGTEGPEAPFQSRLSLLHGQVQGLGSEMRGSVGQAGGWPWGQALN